MAKNTTEQTSIPSDEDDKDPKQTMVLSDDRSEGGLSGASFD